MLVASKPSFAVELKISAAASMNSLLREIVSLFTLEHKDIDISINFGSSGMLANQIDLGAPADLYFSANPRWMDYLTEKGRIRDTSRITFGRNRLVFIGNSQSGVSSLDHLSTLERIGLGNPTNVPAGQYAKQAMGKRYDHLLQSGKLVFAKDVRQALVYADRGEVDGSFVYASDAILARKATILFTVAQEFHEPIIYPVAITTQATNESDAKLFINFIMSQNVKQILIKHGFLPAE